MFVPLQRPPVSFGAPEVGKPVGNPSLLSWSLGGALRSRDLSRPSAPFAKANQWYPKKDKASSPQKAALKLFFGDGTWASFVPSQTLELFRNALFLWKSTGFLVAFLWHQLLLKGR